MKAGDVVALKTGGPNMTVESVIDNAIRCIWFIPYPDGSWSGPNNGNFYLESLVEIS